MCMAVMHAARSSARAYTSPDKHSCTVQPQLHTSTAVEYEHTSPGCPSASKSSGARYLCARQLVYVHTYVRTPRTDLAADRHVKPHADVAGVCDLSTHVRTY
jgi:hypothetical protein